MANEIKNILIDIAEKTYGEKPEYFNLEMSSEERKSFHGQYWPAKRTIQIYNLSRPTAHIISTTIHELAHHIDSCKNGSSAHDKRFYGILKELLETAVKLGYIEYDMVRNKTDSLDISQMEKYYGKISAEYDESLDSNKNFSMIKVSNSFEIKEELKERGYTYSAPEKLWQKKIETENVENEKAELKRLSDKIEILVCKYTDITINAICFLVATGNTYQHKDILKENGFFGKKSGKNFFWIKKIESKDLETESQFLKELNIPFKIKQSI